MEIHYHPYIKKTSKKKLREITPEKAKVGQERKSTYTVLSGSAISSIYVVRITPMLTLTVTGATGSVYESANTSSFIVKALNLKINKEHYNRHEF